MTRLNGELVAVLQKRGEFNTEKMGDESWPGACQVTVHGHVEAGEGWEAALCRETVEELGEKIGKYLRDFGWRLVLEKETEREHVRTYGLLATSNILNDIRWGPSSGGMRLVDEHGLSTVLDLTQVFTKQSGVIYRRDTVMFPDEQEVLCKAFEIFRE